MRWTIGVLQDRFYNSSFWWSYTLVIFFCLTIIMYILSWRILVIDASGCGEEVSEPGGDPCPNCSTKAVFKIS